MIRGPGSQTVNTHECKYFRRKAQYSGSYRDINNQGDEIPLSDSPDQMTRWLFKLFMVQDKVLYTAKLTKFGANTKSHGYSTEVNHEPPVMYAR